MDLNEEREKARYQYHLDLRKLLIDRILIGLLIGVVAFLANLWVERYRSQLGEQRFVLEKRLEAIRQLRLAYADMDDQFNLWSQATQPEVNLTTYRNAIQSFINATKHWDLLVSERLMALMNCHTWAHTALSSKPRNTLTDYRQFVFDLAKDFDSASHSEFEQKAKLDIVVRSCRAWTWREADKAGATAVLESLFRDWKKTQTQ